MIRTLSTSEFARALGLSESSVRRLTDSGEVEVHRTQGGHRRIQVAEAIRFVRQTKSPVVYPEMLGLANAPEPVSNDPEGDMLRVLEEGHATAAIGLMQWLFASGMSIAEMCDGPISAALRRIGERWPHDKRAIFVEHRATILCSRALNQLRLSIQSPDEEAPKALGGAMLGDMYLLPTLMASLVLYDAGLNETNLGPNTPLDVITDAVVDEQPDLIWLSLSEPVRSNSQKSEIIKLGEAALANKATFVIGGRFAKDLLSGATSRSGAAPWVYCNSMTELRDIAINLHSPDRRPPPQ